MADRKSLNKLTGQDEKKEVGPIVTAFLRTIMYYNMASFLQAAVHLAKPPPTPTGGLFAGLFDKSEEVDSVTHDEKRRRRASSDRDPSLRTQIGNSLMIFMGRFPSGIAANAPAAAVEGSISGGRYSLTIFSRQGGISASDL